MVRIGDGDSGRLRLALHGQLHPIGVAVHKLVVVGPDGQRLVTIVADRTDPHHPAQLLVYDVMSGRRLLALSEQDGTVRDLALSPDGPRIILGCSDGTVRIREASPMTPESRPSREAFPDE